MNDQPENAKAAPPPPPMPAPPGAPPWRPAPLLRASERSRTIFVVTLMAAMAPLAAGIVFFGYRAAQVALLSIGACVVLEGLWFRATRTPAMFGRSHAILTGTLLALTLPPFVAWYVPLVAAAFAIIVGKAVFGGVGHFLWQPALVGRLAASAMFGMALSPAFWPVLSPSNVITGDVRACRKPAAYRGWTQASELPSGTPGYLLERPVAKLRVLGSDRDPRYGSLSEALLDLPEIRELLFGATGGGIGETSIIVILVAGMYLIYRHYVHWALPASMIAAAAVTAAIAPVHLAGPGETVRVLWLPFTAEGLDVGLTFVSYHLVGGELVLAAMFLAPEMTSRPVTRMGQVLFGVGCGSLGMLLQLYAVFPLSFYIAVLVMNTFTPVLERITRPRVFGKRWWVWRLIARHGGN